MAPKQMHYTVKATDDSTKNVETVPFVFDVDPARQWPHSTHLAAIMLALDDRYLTLVSIHVGKP